MSTVAPLLPPANTTVANSAWFNHTSAHDLAEWMLVVPEVLSHGRAPSGYLACADYMLRIVRMYLRGVIPAGTLAAEIFFWFQRRLRLAGVAGPATRENLDLIDWALG